VNAHHRRAWRQLAVAATVSLMLVRLISVSQRYPYYFVWDMDHVAVLDSLLINSNVRPDNFGHPGFGMYLALTASQKAARALNVISISTLTDVEESLNPIAGMAEMTDYSRRHSPFLCVAIVLMLWTALCLTFKVPSRYGFLFLLLLGSQESLTYHAAPTRSELSSVFFWSAATRAAAAAATTPRTPVRALGVLGVGLLLGLSFLAKVQALLYLAATICIVLLFISLADEERRPPAVSRRRLYALTSLSVLNILCFTGLTIVAFRTHIPDGIMMFASADAIMSFRSQIPGGVFTFAYGYGITAPAVGVALGLLGLLLVLLRALTRNDVPREGLRVAALMTVLAAGFFLSFGLHFLLLSDRAVSWTYLVYDFKVLFFRHTYLIAVQPSWATTAADFFTHNPLLYLAHLALLVTLAVGRSRNAIRVSLAQLLLCAAATALALVNLRVGVRFVLRDAIWAEMLVNFLSLAYFAIIVTRARQHRARLSAAGATLIAALVAVNGILSQTMLKRIDANYNQYGWRPEQLAAEVFNGNQHRYTAILDTKYDEDTRAVALRAATDHAAIRRTVEFVFPAQSPNHRYIGMAVEKLPVWTRYPNYKIAELPPSLKGAIVVDASSLPIHGRLYQEKLVREPSEYLDKFKASASTDVLPVLTRHDLRILMFVRGDDFLTLQGTFVKPTPFTIALRSESETLEMKGLEITNYSELPVRNFAHNYFFVLSRN
jgi:hypothetical protein